jgi:type I restriction enzyme S subunit
MGSKWIEVSLGEISEKIGDGIHGTPVYNDSGSYFFINGSNLSDNSIKITDTTKRVDYDEFMKYRKELGDNTVLVSINGTIGNTALYNNEDIILGKSACYINLKDNISKYFILYILSGYLFQEYIQRCSTGSTIKNVSLKMMRDFRFMMPESKEDQEEAVHIIKKVDERKRLSNAQNQTLEQMSQTLFKSWFVDFDPVIDNALDAGNSIPEALQSRAELRQKVRNSADFKPLPANIRTLFPAEFEETELGWVPKGWDIVKTEDIALKIGMGPFGSNIKVSTFVDSGVPVISGQHLKEILIIDGGNNFITLEHAEKLKNSAVYRKDIIFTHAGNIGQVSIIPDDSEYDDYIISQRQFYLRVNESKSSPYYLIHYFRSEQGQHALLSNASQVGVPSIARPSTHLRNITFLNPSKPLLEEFDKLCDPLFKRFNQNRKCSISLTDLRDTLLPKLISGELSLEDLPNLANQTEPA